MLRVLEKNHNIDAVTRVEAYTDAVLAIIMTILILNLKVPDLQNTDMTGMMLGLANIYPNILAFIFSFFNIAVIWTNHTHFLNLLKSANNNLYGFNFFIMAVAFAFMVFYCLCNPDLFKIEMSDAEKLMRKKYTLVGPIGFFVSMVVAAFYPTIAYFMYFGVTMIYFLPRKFFS